MVSIKEILAFQSKNKISDIHLITSETPCMRDKTGEIISLDKNELTAEELNQFLEEALEKEELKEIEKNNNGDFGKTIEGIPGRFRINVFKERRGVGMNIRYIPPELPSIKDLSVSNEIVNIINNRSGLLLITGPNNSGKTTLMNSLVDYLNETRKLNIIMFEDPIEYIHERKQSIISQCVIPKNFNDSARQLKSVFRQDADVVCVGEIRGFETMETVLTMCESGYFVIATLHTVDAVQSIERIINMFPPLKKRQLLMQLANELKGVLSQTLVQYKDEYQLIPCREIMLPDDAIKNLIRNGDIQEIYGQMEITTKIGNILFDKYLTKLYENELVSRDTVRQNYHSKSLIKTMLGADILTKEEKDELEE